MSHALAAPAASPTRLLNPRFLSLSVAQTATYASEFFSYVAMSWLVLQLTQSGFVLGALLATQAVPRAVFMLVGGAVTDRVTPFTVMAATGALRAVLVAGLAVLVLSGQAQAWELFPISAALGVLGAFFMPARSSALPAVVDRDSLEAANAVIFIASQISSVAGPALAGLVVARAGSGPAFLVDAAGFAIASVVCLPLRARGGETTVAQKPSALIAAIREGFRFVWHDPLLRALWIGITALNFASNGPFEVGVTVIAKQRWGGAWALGIEFGSIALGALVGAAVSSKLRDRFPLGKALIAISFAFAIGLPLIGLAPAVWGAALVTCALGVVNGYIFVIGMAWLQRRTPSEMLGRVMALIMFGSFGVGPISYAIAGSLVGISTEAVFLLGGAVCLAVAAGSLASRTVRESR